MSEALQRIVDALEANWCKPSQTAAGWLAFCPTHNSKEPSLTVTTDARGGVTLTCPDGCKSSTILAAIGLPPEAADPVPIDGAPIVLCMRDVEAKPVDWLWPERIPRGCVTVLAGRPGEGKSFAAADLAARVSTGRDWPDGTTCPVGDVLLVCGEDDPATTIRPRLDAHGADANRVHLLRAVRRVRNGAPGEAMFTLNDVPALEAAMQGLSAPALCVIDPIGSFIGGKVDAHRDNEVRAVLAPIAALAERHRVAVLVVAHHNKGASTRADDLIMGSRAFPGLARSVQHLMRDPDDDDRRLLLPGKLNLSRKPTGLAFRIEGEPARLVWEPEPVQLNADGVLAAMAHRGGKATRRDDAAAWLRDFLSDGPRPAADVFAAADVAGFPQRTVERAKAAAGVEVSKAGFGGAWVWRLAEPAEDRQLPHEGRHTPELGGLRTKPEESLGNHPKTANSAGLAPLGASGGNLGDGDAGDGWGEP